jgi:hypothetical protein
MASQMLGPRKRRTRQHVIADLSVHHVEGFILEEGHTTQRLGSDYGYDLIVRTFDDHGFIEPGAVYFQFKAMETLHEIGVDYVFRPGHSGLQPVDAGGDPGNPDSLRCDQETGLLAADPGVF